MAAAIEIVVRDIPGGGQGEVLKLTGMSQNAYRMSGLPDGEGEYVFSVWAAADSGAAVSWNILGVPATSEAAWSWNRLEIPVVAAGGTGYIDVMPETDGAVYLYEAKLEKGNKATDWTPAPEDGEEAIRDAYSRIELTDEQIRLEVGRINTIGGRNLWRRTKEYDPTRYSGWIVGGSEEPKAPYMYTDDGFGVQRVAEAWADISQHVAVEQGEKYTLSAWMKWENSWNTADIWMCADDINILVNDQMGISGFKRVAVTYTATTNTSTCRFECRTDAPYLIYGVQLERGDKATDWSPSPFDPASEVVAGSTVAISEDKVNISTPEFIVDIPTTQGMDVRVTELGFEAPIISSPSVAKAMEGGIFTVGAGGDFTDLAEAFGNIGNRHISEDITLKVFEPEDHGGTLSGVTGSGRVIVAPINFINTNNMAAWENVSATVTSMGQTDGIYLKAKANGAKQYARLNIGYVGPLGLRGKKMTFRCTMYSGSASAPAYPRVSIVCGDAQWVWLVRDESQAATGWVTSEISFTVPERMGYWDEFYAYFYMSESQRVTTSATAYFRDPRLEIGDGISSLNNGLNTVTVNEMKVEGCSAQAAFHNLIFTSGISTAYSGVTVNRCTLNGANGFMLWGGSGAIYNCYGTCSGYAARASGGGAIEIFGSRPSGAVEGLVDDSQASGDTPGGEEPVTSNTMTFEATKSGTYSGSGWWKEDAALRQGYTAANGEMRGAAWFDLSAIAGKTITKMTLRLRRVEGYGRSSDANVRVFGTKSAALSGSPSTSGSAVEKQMSPGETKTIDVSSLISNAANGNTYGFVLYVNDGKVMSGRTYSTNFARFTGTGGSKNTIPMLTVTYR